MSAIQQALVFPFEITSGLKDFSVNYGGGGATPLALDAGVSGSMLTTIWQLDDLLSNHNAALSAYLNTSNRVVIASSSSSFTVDWTDTALGTLLGFRDNLSSGTSHTATDPPKYIWLADYHSNDLEWFSRESTFKGSMASDGTNSGISLTPALYRRNIQWSTVLAANVFQSASTESFVFDSTTHYPQEERCLQYLLHHALASSPTEDTAEGLSTKGCYWVPNLTAFEGVSPTVALTSSWGGGGVKTDLTTAPDRYVFCGLDPRGWSTPKSDLDRSKAYFKLSLLLTAHPESVPTWNTPA